MSSEPSSFTSKPTSTFFVAIFWPVPRPLPLMTVKYRGAEMFEFVFVAELFVFELDAPAFVPLFALPPARRTTASGKQPAPSFGTPQRYDKKHLQQQKMILNLSKNEFFQKKFRQRTPSKGIRCSLVFVLFDFRIVVKYAERRGDVRIRIRGREVRARVGRARTRAKGRITASETNLLTVVARRTGV